MKKILIASLIVFLSACSSKDRSNFKGCEYKVVNNLFSSNTEIVISGRCTPIDLCIIILDQIMDGKEEKALKIKITDDNIKYLSKEDVLYIRNNASKITEYDNTLRALFKAQVIVDRISNYK